MKDVVQATIVRDVEDLATLAIRINSYIESGDVTRRESLMLYHKAGQELIRAKEMCPWGTWVKWVKQNIKCPIRKVQRYMRFGKYDVTSYLKLDEINRIWSLCNENSSEKVDESGQNHKEDIEENPSLDPAPPPVGVEETVETVGTVNDTAHVKEVTAEKVEYQEEEEVEQGSNPAEEYPSKEQYTPSISERVPLDTVPTPMPPNYKPNTRPKQGRLGKIGEYVTLTDWDSLSNSKREKVLERASRTSDSKAMNRQEGASIEWAQWSWNPVTGCKHDCPYCYARDIAERLYKPKFEPTLWPDRLSAPINVKYPTVEIEELTTTDSMEDKVHAMGLGNVFTCSMADLFGRWVPKEWIDIVLNRCRESKEWTFLFLTKFPNRMAEFVFSDNCWVGTTVDCQARVRNAEKSFRNVNAKVKWLSCEPLIERLRFSDIGAFDWVVIGGASRSSKTPEWSPPREWIHNLEEDARRAGVKVYEKDNLKLSRIRQYPNLDTLEANTPQELLYLPPEIG